MARPAAVLSGLRAAQAASQSSSRSPVHPNYVSPLLGQYAQWTMGRQSQAMALPRDPLAFLTGAFGPLAPIKPIGVDEPHGDEERPMLRRWQYPVAWNMPVGSPGSEGLKLADFQTLRLYSEIYSVARACIQLRKDEILGIGWDIGPTHDASKAMRDDREARKDFGDRRAKILRFFGRPDPNYNDFTTWLEAVLEDIFVIDALSIYLHPPRIPGKGVLGSNLAGLDLIAGETIRPLLDLRGQSPAPPNPAYQQYLYGVPRTDLMTILSGEDLKDLGIPDKEYRGDQLLYLPRNPRSWTPYGQSPMERCIVPVITGLRRQQWQMDYYLEGTVPGMFVAPGDPDMTPNQIRELQDTLNALAGDQAWKHKIIVLPAGSRIEPQKPPQLSDTTDEMIMTEVAMAYSVMPMELGIFPVIPTGASASLTAGERMAKASADVHERKTLKPDLLWLKVALFDKVIQEICGQHDMEWRWDGLEEDKDELNLTNMLIAQIGAGLCSIDEARIEIGRDPWGTALTQDPGWATAAGFMPLGAINPDTGLPAVSQGPQPNGVPAIPGSPEGSSRSGRAPDGAGGGAAQPAGYHPASSQAKPVDPIPGARPQSPAHDQATASEIRAGEKRPVPKAILAEADALRRHLNKGRDIATWEARWLPGHFLTSVAEDLGKGLTPDEAVRTATAMLPPVIDGTGLVVKEKATAEDQQRPVDPDDLRDGSGGESAASGRYKPDELSRQVARQLLEDYPQDSLDWVLYDAQWSGPFEIPLDRIDYSNRQSWNAWHEPDRIKEIQAKMERKARKGGHLKPAILVDRPNTERGSHLIVIDGHHRSLAALRAGKPLWAYIGKVNKSKGDWLTFHNRQYKEGQAPGEDEFADEPKAA